MIFQNAEMKRADLTALFALASAPALAGKIKHGPFSLFNPLDAGGGNYFDLLPPFTVTDRGGWAAGTYNAGDQVFDSGYLFISVINGNTFRPMDQETGDPNGGWRQPWYSCYQRFRDEVHAAVLFWQQGGAVNLFRESVSGPWPCQSPSVYYDQLAFYFEDTGRTESVSLQNTTGGGSILGKFGYGTGELVWDGTPGGSGAPSTISAPSVLTQNPDGSDTVKAVTWMDPAAAGNRRIIISFINDMEWKLVVGGTKPVVMNGTFKITATVIRGVTYGYREDGTGHLAFDGPTVDIATDPIPMLNIDASHFIGGFTTELISPPSGFLELYATIVATCTLANQTVNPGTYIVRANSGAAPNFSGEGVFFEPNDGSGTFTGSNTWQHQTYLDISQGLDIAIIQSITVSDTVDTPGIDDVKQIKKIQVNNFGDAGGFGMQVLQNYGTFNGLQTVPVYPFGNGPLGAPFQTPSNIYYIPGYPDPGPGQFPAFGPPVYTTTAWLEVLGGISITTTTPGYWLGVTPPVNSLGMMPFERMPWNQFPHTLPTSGAGTATENKYLGYTLPYTGGKNFDNQDSRRAYEFEQPSWLPASDTAELQPWPKRWKANTHYPLGFTIIDSYGNLHTLRAPAGRSGAAEPAWRPALGAITLEPNYLDLTSHTLPGARWELTKLLRPGPTAQRSTPYALNTTVIDDNGNTQRCTTAGDSGAPPVNWSTTLGGITADGTVVWTLARINARLAPAVARLSPPIYPFFWQNPVSQWLPNHDYTAGATLTDSKGNTQQAQGDGTSGPTEPIAWDSALGGLTLDGTLTWVTIKLAQPSLTDPNIQPFSNGFHPFSFAPQGWWIYRVFLNRIPQTKSTEKPPAAPLAVELGCIRNGAFVSFGTFHTGTPVDALWPVFTNTALAYRCSERIDVQAEILTCGLNYGTWGGVSYPLAAAHVNDLEALIGKLAS